MTVMRPTPSPTSTTTDHRPSPHRRAMTQRTHSLRPRLSHARRRCGCRRVMVGVHEGVRGARPQVRSLTLSVLVSGDFHPVHRAAFRSHVVHRKTHFVHPVPVTDLTRCSTLDALCRSQIAPRSTLCARAAHGLLRGQHLELSHRLRIAPPAMLGVPRQSQIAPLLAPPALRLMRIAPRSALDAL
jgi:hypothetical protein